MSSERAILEGIAQRRKELESAIDNAKTQIAKLKSQLQKLKRAEVALNGSTLKPTISSPGESDRTT